MRRLTVKGNPTINQMTDSVARKHERGELLAPIHRAGSAVDAKGGRVLYEVMWVPIVLQRVQEDT